MLASSFFSTKPFVANGKSRKLIKFSESSAAAGTSKPIEEDQVQLIQPANAFTSTNGRKRQDECMIIANKKHSNPLIQVSSSSVSKIGLKPQWYKNKVSKTNLKPSYRSSSKLGRSPFSASALKHSKLEKSSFNKSLESNLTNLLMASAIDCVSASGGVKTPIKVIPTTAASTPATTTTPTKSIVINQPINANKSPSHAELSILPTISPQLILSSIITTQASLCHELGVSLANQISVIPTITATTTTATSNTAINTTNTTDTNFITPTTTTSSSKNTTTTEALTPSIKSPRNNCQKPAKAILVVNTTNKSSSSDQNQTTSPVGQAVNARLIDLGKRLLDAAREGSIDSVRQLVFDSSAPFTSDWLGTTALHLAAQNGHAGIAEILLRGGVNRDAKTKLERTALHLAAQGGFLDVVDLLLIHGCDANARDMLKMTPLHWAVERGHIFVVERLLYSGADINARSKFYLTPIDIAYNSKSYKMIEIFKSWTNKHDILDPHSSNHNNVVFNDSSSMLEVDYHLAYDDERATTSQATVLDINEPCIDLVELEWSTLKFEPDFFLTNDEDEPKVGYLMKVVDELQKENRQLRKKVEQLSTTCQ